MNIVMTNVATEVATTNDLTEEFFLSPSTGFAAGLFNVLLFFCVDLPIVLCFSFVVTSVATEGSTTNDLTEEFFLSPSTGLAAGLFNVLLFFGIDFPVGVRPSVDTVFSLTNVFYYRREILGVISYCSDRLS